MPGSVMSATSRRSMMPVVSTMSRVSRPTFESNRTW